MSNEIYNTNIKTIYLASAYEYLPLLRDVVFLLEATGRFKSTSRWLLGGHEPGKVEETPDMRSRWAAEDLADISEAEIFLLVNHGRPTPGRHTEFGYALALEKSCILVGEPSSIFHYHERCQVFGTIEMFLAYLNVPGRMIGPYKCEEVLR